MRIVITGTTGYLGSCVAQLALKQGHEILSITRRSHQIFSGQSGFTEVFWGGLEGLHNEIEQFNPDVIIHTAAMTSAPDCEKAPQEAQEANIELFRRLLTISSGTYTIYVSTDLVFDGVKVAPKGGFVESNKPTPVSVYSKTKFAGEGLLRERGNGCVARVSLLYGPSIGERRGALGWMYDAISKGQKITLFEDEFRTPIYVFDAAQALIELSKLKYVGTVHCSGGRRLSRADFGEIYADLCGGLKSCIIKGLRDSNSVPLRPADVSLSVDLLQILLPMWNPLPIEEGLNLALKGC